MNSEQRRALLELVASGECSPEEAAALLAEDAGDDEEPASGTQEPAMDDPGQGDPGPDEPAIDDRLRVVTATVGSAMRNVGTVIERELHAAFDDERGDRTSAPPTDGFGSVRVHVAAGKARIIGDATIEGLDVEGPHTLERDGDTMVVDCDGLRTLLSDFDVDVARTGRSRFSKSFVITNTNPGRRRRPTPGTTTVRVNPALPITIEVAAGSAKATDLHGPITARIDAGSLHLDEATGPLDVAVHAGSFSGRARLTGGEHRISCEAGSVSLDLDDRSDVRVAVTAELGSMKLELPGDDAPERDGRAHVFTVGDGRGDLAISTTMGSCRVRVSESVRR